MSASYFKKDNWTDVTLDQESISIPPKETIEVNAMISTTKDQKTGIYDGFLKFEGEHHTINVPVSYVIVEKIKKDIPFTFIVTNNDVPGTNLVCIPMI